MTRPSDARLASLFGLDGRVALVTGARHGIGRAIALVLAQAGADIVLAGREPDRLGAVVAEIAATGARVATVQVELGDPSSIEQAVQASYAYKHRLDVVVNNAGLSIRRPASEYTIGEWDAVVDTNLRAPFLVARAAAEKMRPGGRIVNVSSAFGVTAVRERAPYSASKAGLEHLTRLLAVEWAARGITVNAVAPGLTRTETRRDLFKEPNIVAQRMSEIPLGRLGEPEDVVGAVLMLVGAAGGFITGHTVRVDGGYTLGA